MFCAALYADGFWYRARITKIERNAHDLVEFHVYYIDYGNSAALQEHELTALDAELMDYEPQAVRCCLGWLDWRKNWSEKDKKLFCDTFDSHFLEAYFYQSFLMNCENENNLIYFADIFKENEGDKINALSLFTREELMS
ncbi:Tudor domain-containing protein 1-like protein [Dinothrombium tinctorium]|uniref:Tudor domain-containing protein 1-like protein n=1 Tax=Dinothrombium tinctorium TaxID=1965070 RepID=A0A3S3S2N7_9ACAR|nr:Tudor domain-containing protein 1-like protein [Dinothrombium tinctorium]